MIQAAFPLFLLRRLSWSSFDFPRWQAWTALVLGTVLWVFALHMNLGWDYLAALSARMGGISLTASRVTMLVHLAAVLGFQRWWMQRGQRSLLNLIAAAWLVSSVLGAGLVAAGMPRTLEWLLWLYDGWIVANALTGAVYQASLACSLGGVAAISVAGVMLQDLTGRLSVSVLNARSAGFS